MMYEDETPLADELEQDGDGQHDYDPTGDAYNEYQEGYSNDADDYEGQQLALDGED